MLLKAFSRGKRHIAMRQAYEAAGADALYAPGLTTLEDMRALCSAVRKPTSIN